MRFRVIGLIGIMTFIVSFVVFAQPGNAQAALTLNNFIGFETGGLDEAIAVDGTPTAVKSSPSPHSGDYSLQLNDGTDDYDIPYITGGSTDSDNDFIFGFWINFVTSKTPSSVFSLLKVRDDTPGTVFDLELQTDADIELIDAASGSMGVITDPFTIGTWHLIEIRWQHLASGDIDVYIDGVEAFSSTGEDLTDGGTVSADDATYDFKGSSSSAYNIDDLYMLSGATSTSDFLGNTEVFRYQNRENSTTSDSSTCVSLSNNLDQGVWQDVGETPLGVDSGVEPAFQANGDGGLIFTDDTASGDNGRHGPHGDANIDGDSNIRGAKWLHRLRRGGGGSGDHSLCFGNDVDSVSSTVVTLGTGFENFFTISETASEQPLSTEHFSQGMHTAANRDIEGEEFWSFILHVPDAGVARRIFPVQ